MNRQQRRRAARHGYVPEKREPLKTQAEINVEGLGSIIEQLPDDRFYCMRIYFNRFGLIHIDPTIQPIAGKPPQ